MKKPWILSYPSSAQQRLIRLDRGSGWSESLLGTSLILLVLSFAGSNMITANIFAMLSWQQSWHYLSHVMRKPILAICEQHWSACTSSIFVIRSLDGIIPLISIPIVSILLLASAVEQAGLNLTWLQTPKTGFLMMWLTYRHKRIKSWLPMLLLQTKIRKANQTPNQNK